MESVKSNTPVGTKRSRFLLLWCFLETMLVTHNGEESSQPEDNQVAVADTAVPPPEDDALAKVNLPRKLPSIVEIKKALPQHCFESSTSLSIYFMIKDFILILILYVASEWTWEVLPPIAQLVVTPIYWLAQGTMFTAIFVVGHDAGHGSFSSSELVNTVCGNITHTFLLCPYYMWKVTHQKHHKNTGNIDKDEVFYPSRKCWGSDTKLMPGFGLGLGWFFYLLKGYNPRGIPHLNPLHPFFRQHVLQCSISFAGLVIWGLCLTYFKDTFGFGALFYHYMVPLFIFATYTLIITFLHHTEDEIPWYSDNLWNNVRGQLSTVDRSYGWCHYIIHNIGTHQVHHLFPKVPHYHLEEATVEFRKAFPKLVNIRHEPILPAFIRMFKKFSKQSLIPDNTQVHLYK